MKLNERQCFRDIQKLKGSCQLHQGFNLYSVVSPDDTRVWITNVAPMGISAKYVENNYEQGSHKEQIIYVRDPAFEFLWWTTMDYLLGLRSEAKPEEVLKSAGVI